MTVLLYTQLTNSPVAIGNCISLCCLANGVIPEARRAVRDPLEEHRGARPGSGSNANWHHPAPSAEIGRASQWVPALPSVGRDDGNGR